MPFDSTNPAHLATLRTEIETDPVGQGYRSPVDHLANGASVEILQLLRAADAGGATNTTQQFSGDDLLDACMGQPTELNSAVFAHANAEQRKVWYQRMINHGDQPIPVRFHASILGVFSQALAPTIRAAIIAEATGPQRREEVVFGDDSVVTREGINSAIALWKADQP